MKRTDVKSDCPVNYSLEIFGDPWSLLIVRSMITYGAKTYGDFLKSRERIGTSVLANRLAHLEAKGIIAKSTDPTDQRKVIYALTETGIGLLPILYEIAVWGSRTSPHPQASEAWFKAMELDRNTVLGAWREALKSGDSFMLGPNSVVARLGL